MSIVRLFVKEPAILPGITDGLNDLFTRRQIAVEMVQAHGDGVSFAVPTSPHLPELLRVIDPSVRIEVEEQHAIVTLVGEGVAAQSAIRGRALAAIERNTPVRMLTQGGSSRSIHFAVPEAKLGIAVESLHREFFRAADPEIFAATPESSRELLVETIAGQMLADRNWGIAGSPQPAQG
jgi:aspartokinase